MSAPIKNFDPSETLELSEDDLFAPADLSEVSIAPCALPVQTLSNSPGCVPAGMRPVRRPAEGEGRVQTDAWSTPAPANWGRSRRVRSVQARDGRRSLLKVGNPNRPGRRAQATPSSDWALPF